MLGEKGLKDPLFVSLHAKEWISEWSHQHLHLSHFLFEFIDVYSYHRNALKLVASRDEREPSYGLNFVTNWASSIAHKMWFGQRPNLQFTSEPAWVLVCSIFSQFIWKEVLSLLRNLYSFSVHFWMVLLWWHGGSQQLVLLQHHNRSEIRGL